MNIPTVTDSPEDLRATIRKMQTRGYPTKKMSRRGKLSEKMISIDNGLMVFSYAPTTKKIVQTCMIATQIVSIVVEDAIENPTKTNSGSQIYGVLVDVEKATSDADKKAKTFKLYFDTKTDQQRVAQIMAFVVRTRNTPSDEDPMKVRILELWIQADADGDQRLSTRELCNIFKIMSIQISQKDALKLLKQHDLDNSGFLDYQEFQSLFDTLMARGEFDEIFKHYAQDIEVRRHSSTPTSEVGSRRQSEYGTTRKWGKTEPVHVETKTQKSVFMKPEDLQKFLKEAQGEYVDLSVVKRLMQTLGMGKTPGITAQQFCSFLCSPKNGWMLPQHKTVYQDMTFPLKDYFMNSSHNTYLSGDQLGSQSKVEMYKIALERGCRCVELDCWDGPNGQPIVYHGYTLTTKILFSDVINCINQYAFLTSPFPVVLSLEIHASLEQQRVMANELRKVFSSKLARFEDVEDTYTPEGLKNKIIIKGKRLPDDEDEKERGQEAEVGEDVSSKTFTGKVSWKKVRENVSKIATELSNAIAMPAKKTKDWGLTSQSQSVQSFTESNIETMALTNPQDLRNLCSRMFARIYPKGSRINSSNYDPILAWAMGCQIVALNYQTFDFPMRLNYGRFKQNGNCGYVLKPKWLRTVDGVMPHKPFELKVDVLIGSQLSQSTQSRRGDIIDPYIEVFVSGIPEDTTPTPYRTKTVDNNGFNPVWLETVKFKIRCLELACLTIRVMDSELGSDVLLAEASIPVESLRLGYRSVPLVNPVTGITSTYSTVICHFSLQEIEAALTIL